MKTHLCIFLLFTSLVLKANHIIGGDLSYECLGGDEYKFTLMIVRDCAWGGAGPGGFDSSGPGTATGTVTIFEGSSILVNINLDSPEIEEVSLSESQHPCPDNLGLCIERGVYEFTYTLPKSDESYTITYQRCCRTPRIINIFDPVETGMTFTVDINTLSQELCNSSPLINRQLEVIACVNEPFLLNFSALENDIDEVRYFLCSPLLGGGLAGLGGGPYGGVLTDIDGIAPNPDAPPPYIDIDYNEAAFSVSQPFGINNNVELDSTTGILFGEATTIGTFVYGVCVEEYRSGQLLSTVRREAILDIVNCDPTSACTPNSTEDVKLVEQLQIFPNPTTDEFNISLDKGSVSAVKLYDFSGRALEEWGKETNKISLQNYSGGVFIVEVQDNVGSVFRGKVVKTDVF